jgi:hypothetical protein
LRAYDKSYGVVGINIDGLGAGGSDVGGWGLGSGALARADSAGNKRVATLVSLCNLSSGLRARTSRAPSFWGCLTHGGFATRAGDRRQRGREGAPLAAATPKAKRPLPFLHARPCGSLFVF